MTIPVFVPGMHIDDNGNLVIDADEMAEAGVKSIELIEGTPESRIAELKAELKAARETIADKQAWIERAAKEAAKQNAEIEARLKEACAKIEHQRNWYGCRSQRLQQFAKEEMLEAQQKRFFSIMANGTADANESPTYAQQYNMLKDRAEQAEARLAEVIGIKDEIVEDREREYQRWKQAEARAEAAEASAQNGRILNDEMNGRLGDLLEAYEEVVEGNRALSQRAEKAEADAGRLRIVLERIEWINDICPWCYSDMERGHLPDCARQAALRAEGEESEVGK